MKTMRNKGFLAIIAVLMSFVFLLGAGTLNPTQILNNAYDSTTGTLKGSLSMSTWKDTTALTNLATYPATLEHQTTATPAAGIGVGMRYYQETSAGNTEIGGYTEAVVTDATAGSEDFEFNIGLMAAGAAADEVLSISSVGVVTLDGGATIDNSTAATELVIAETNIQLTGIIDLEGGAVTVNDDSGDYDFKIEGNGVDPLIYTDAGNDRVGIGTATPDVQFESLYSGSSTNTVDNQFKISSLTSGSPANGIGTGIQFETETSAANYEVGMNIDSVTTDVTAGSEDFTFSVKLIAAGAAAAEKFSVTSTGVVTLVNAATLDNSTNGTLTVTEPVLSLQGTVVNKSCTLGDTDLTPDVVAGCYWLVSQANTGATAITDLDNPSVGATYCILVGSATNPPTLADAGNFNLSAAWTPGLDDIICLYVQADNDYIEISRSDN